MRRSASEIIKNLEMRVARLERQASKVQLKVDTYFEIKYETIGVSAYTVYHFLPGTILRVEASDWSRGGYGGWSGLFEIIKLNAGSEHKFTKRSFRADSIRTKRGNFVVDFGEADTRYMKIVQPPNEI